MHWPESYQHIQETYIFRFFRLSQANHTIMKISSELLFISQLIKQEDLAKRRIQIFESSQS